jgi:hypothetical protein
MLILTYKLITHNLYLLLKGEPPLAGLAFPAQESYAIQILQIQDRLAAEIGSLLWMAPYSGG